MKNVFNECNCATFLDHVSQYFPEITPWVHWCYSQPAELQFGNKCILFSTGVQQGDPLGPLLLSLVLVQLLNSTSFDDTCLLCLSYLDDGTFIGSRSSLRTVFSGFADLAPHFGLHINFSKCELRGGWTRSRELQRATKINYAKSVFWGRQSTDLSIRQSNIVVLL